jgi:capsule biosynthesis phosphatase
MNIIVPLLGSGSRFKEADYPSSKSLVKYKTKEIIFYLLDQLVVNQDKVYVIHRSDLENERFSEKVKSRYGERVTTHQVNYNTSGAAHTLQIALKSFDINLEDPLAVCDSDTFYDKDHINEIRDVGNCIFHFEDLGKDPIYSYIKTDKTGKVLRIKEKSKISNLASVGTYCFDSGITALKYCEKVLKKDIKQKGEHYISSVFQEMIDDNVTVTTKQTSNFKCLGTPAQLQSAKTDTLLRICFDLDNTLVTEPRIKGDYSTVEPIQKNIDFLNDLKREGHTIIIHTARGMKSCQGKVGVLSANIGKVTFDTLEKFQIPYDEIYFGKPFADAYIDDKSVDAYGDLEKLTGVYRNPVINRNHNRVSLEEEVVRKISKNKSISGELYWYKNLPKEVSHLFPKLVSSREGDETEICTQKIEGTTLSRMLINGSVNREIIHELFNSITLIHSSVLGEINNSNPYDNYARKTEERFQKFDSSLLQDKSNESFYSDIIRFLHDYEENNSALISNIHGDPVFTNILIDKDNRMKFIDMRGLQGKVLTITGDKNYDYAKIYQSLLGYDSIVHDCHLDDQYLEFLRKEFVAVSKCNVEIIRKLSSSLLFSCIPLQPRKLWSKLLFVAKDSFYNK